MKQDSERERAILWIVDLAARSGKVADALEIARKIQDSGRRAAALARIAVNLPN
jgi:hypothetical protein